MKKLFLLLAMLMPLFAWAQLPPVAPVPQASALVSQTYKPLHFSQLNTTPNQANGTMGYCDNCQKSIPCADGGQGAFFKRTANVWDCTDPGIMTSNVPGTDFPATHDLNYNNFGAVGMRPAVAPNEPIVYGQTGAKLSGLDVGTLSANINTIINVVEMGAIGDGTTDNTTAFRAAVTTLGATGGRIFVPASSTAFNINSTIIFPKNVILECAAPDATEIHYTGSVAALVWSDSTSNSYRRGGMANCKVTGTAKTGIGIYTGGDPANTITPSGNFGDFLTFTNNKVEQFAVGYKAGSHTWENHHEADVFTDNTIGWQIPNNAVECCENMSFDGGAIQNDVNSVVNNNPDADLTFTSTSFDAVTGIIFKTGEPSGSQNGGLITLNKPHIEYLGAQDVLLPTFQLWGVSPHAAIMVDGGKIQYDAPGVVMPEATANITGGAGFGTGTAKFHMAGTLITSNLPLQFSGTCLATALGQCYEGDGALSPGLDLGVNSYWDATQQTVNVPQENGLVIGKPTGGYKGLGTINAESIFVNGVVAGGGGGGSGLPNGDAPQIVGYSGINSGESENVIGDFTFVRTAPNTYTATVTKAGGNLLTSATFGATLNLTTNTGVSTNTAFQAAAFGTALNLTAPPDIGYTTPGKVKATRFDNVCQGTVTLSGGTGSASNACITNTSAVWCVDTTGANGGSCAVSAGTLTVTGTGTDVIAWVNLSTTLGTAGGTYYFGVGTGGSGVTCAGCTTNLLSKFNGSNLANSSITDNGTTVSTTEPVLLPNGQNLTTNGGTLPSKGSCGTGALVTANSTMLSGSVTIGSTNPQATCPITFATACTNALNCQLTDAGSFQPLKPIQTSTSVLTITAQTDMHNDKIYWSCQCN